MSLPEIYKIVTNIAAFSVVIPILFCLIRIKALNKSLWAFFIYLILCIIVDRVNLILLPEEKAVNIVSNIFTILETAIICFIYFNEFSQRKTKLAVAFIFLAFFIFALIKFFFQNSYEQLDNTVSTVEASIIIVLAGSFLHKLLLDPEIPKLEQHYFYWINLAFLLYFATALILFMNSDFFEHCKPTTGYILWGLHLILNIVTNILSSIGIWNSKRKLL